ncbi:MAG: TetR family transcriptional regulator, partial [Clostridiales bacterium]|nr:TetR family transcriptional regulator [Clostridiales bacterium]
MSELIEKRSLDKITVKDLVEECGISRQTFYYHFQDLFDVVEWMMERILERKIEEGLCISDPEEALYGMLTYTPKQK